VPRTIREILTFDPPSDPVDAIERLLHAQVEQVEAHAQRGDAWRTDPTGVLVFGVFRQLFDLGVLTDNLRRGPEALTRAQRRQVLKTCANLANYAAFLAARYHDP
jgi:hypothetical protein